MAVVAEVGMPSVSSGASAAVTVALLAASGPATPSMAPGPPLGENSSGCFESFFSVAYDRNVGISAPPAGISPKGNPISVPRSHAGTERRQSSRLMWVELMRFMVASAPR